MNMATKSRRHLTHALGCLAGLLLAMPAHAEPRLTLYLADSPRPGILTGCEMYFFARTEGQPWRQVAQPIRLEWAGGGVDLNVGAQPGGKEDKRQEHCFRLDLDGKILTGGAVISSNSARRLDFPVLVESIAHEAKTPVLTLHPRWPTKESDVDDYRAMHMLRQVFQ